MTAPNPNDELKALAAASEALYSKVAAIEHAVGCAVRYAAKERAHHAQRVRELALLHVPPELEAHKARALERMRARARLLEEGVPLQARIDLATDRLEDARTSIKRGVPAEDVRTQLADVILVLNGDPVNEPGI